MFVQIESKLRADYTATLVGNWGYWIPAQIINFRFVAPVYQVCWSWPLLYCTRTILSTLPVTLYVHLVLLVLAVVTFELTARRSHYCCTAQGKSERQAQRAHPVPFPVPIIFVFSLSYALPKKRFCTPTVSASSGTSTFPTSPTRQ